MRAGWKLSKGKVSVAVVMAALIVGAALGAGLSGSLTRQAVAQQGEVATPRGGVAPGSFADLADRLSTSVVNIRVTKVEKVSGAFMGGPGESFPGLPDELQR